MAMIGIALLVGLIVLGILAAVVALLLVWAGGRRRGWPATALVIVGGVLLLACACAAAFIAWWMLVGSTPAAPLPPTSTATPIATPTPKPTRAPTSTPTPVSTATPSPQPTTPPPVATSIASYPVEVQPYAASLLPAEQAVVAALDDPPIYTLDVRVDWESLTVAGTETLLFTNNEGVVLDALYLRLYPNARHYDEGETAIGEVLVDDEPVEYEVDGTVLEVTLPRPLHPEERLTLTIPFTVTVPRRADRFGFDQGVMMLGHWYPMLAVYDDEGWNLDPYVPIGDAFYSDAGFYTVRLTVPDGTVVAATGVEIGRTRLRAPETRIIFVSGATRDFALALSPEFRTVSRQVGQTQVTSYYLPGHEAGGRKARDVAAAALEIYSDRFGPYPYTEFDVAETPFLIEGSPGGMEYPGLVFISTSFHEGEGFYADELDVILAHEVAHQWWYGVVGNNQVDEPWLDEAFATFCQILYVEEAEGEERAQAELALWVELPYLLVVLMEEDRPVATSLLDFEGDSVGYAAIVYAKGALFLRELQALVGDETFFSILQHHYAAHKYGLLGPDDFRQAVADVTDDDPAALELYELWVLSDETPLDPEDFFDLPELEGDFEELFESLEELPGGSYETHVCLATVAGRDPRGMRRPSA